MAGLHEVFAGLIAQYGLLALFLAVGLECLGLPLPGETAIVVAATAAGAGSLDIRAVASIAFAAAVIGDNIAYLVGRKVGRPVLLRHGARIGLSGSRLDRLEQALARHGPVMVVVARFIVVMRQFNGLVAGSTGMHWARFLVANMIGAALWVGLWTAMAYGLGRGADAIPAIWHRLHLGGTAGVLLVLALLAILYRKLRRRSPR